MRLSRRERGLQRRFIQKYRAESVRTPTKVYTARAPTKVYTKIPIGLQFVHGFTIVPRGSQWYTRMMSYKFTNRRSWTSPLFVKPKSMRDKDKFEFRFNESEDVLLSDSDPKTRLRGPMLCL